MTDPTLTVEYVERIAAAQRKREWQEAEARALRYGPESYWAEQFAKLVARYYPDPETRDHA